MAPDLDSVREFVHRLARRERRLLAARVGLQGGLLLCAWVGLLAWGAAAGWSRPAGAALSVLLLGVGAWFGVVAPLWRGWRAAASPERQARLAEALDPELRGRLLTAVAHPRGAQGGESDVLLGLVARRAAARVRALPPARVHPGRRLGWLAVVGGAAGVAALLAALLVPGGPLALFRHWAGTAYAEGQSVAAAAPVDGPAARVGDILLRYVYPDYTGLDPVEVPNSTGEAHGPPGTVVEVRARAADPVRSAALIAYDQPPLEAIVSEGREISSRFTIGSQPGTWRLVLAGQGEPRTTREYPITPEGDLPPDVTVDGDDSYEVAVDAIIDLTWSARDDFGLSRVTLEVDEREGRELRVPRERVAEVSGVASFRPVDLGLGPGDVVSLTVAAWDNDEVAGSKVGRSRVIRLTVLGQAARDRRRAERTDALIEAMLAVLADHLEDPWPAGDTEGELAAWGEALSGRYAAIEEVIAEYWDDLPQDAKERRQVERVVSTARDLIRYTQVSFTPGSPVEPPEQAFVVTAELRDAAVVALEDAILFLDTLVREEALGRVARQTEDAARLAERLSEVLAAEDPDPLAVAAQLDQLERMLAELTRQAARLEAGPLREFVNQRTSELQSLLEAAREALAAGEMEEARRLMERIARDLQQLAEGVEDELSRRGEQDSELREQAADLDAELARLEAEERQLQEDVTALRDASDESQRDRLDALWRELDEVTARMAEATGAYAEGLERAERSFNERERGASLDEAANQLGQASQARDLGGAEREAARARLEQVGVQRALDREERARGGQLPGPGRAELGAVQRELARAEQLIEQLRQADQQWDPRMAQRLSELESRQQALQEQLEAARGMAEQLTRELPMEPRGMSEALEEAGEQMGRAGRSMQRGEAMGAEGSAGAAAQRIAEAREALREAMQQGSAGSQARRRGQGQPGGEDEGEGQAEGEGEEEGGQGFRDRPLELPAPEEFRTPEEYRRALLEGMEGDVPEEYRALKRRYYEELVNQ